MLEIFAGLWWGYLLVSMLSLLGVVINYVLITYGTVLDVAGVAWEASKLKKEGLPKDRAEWKEKAIEVATTVAVAKGKEFIVKKLFGKLRKFLFGTVLMFLGIFTGILFVFSMFANLGLWIFA